MTFQISWRVAWQPHQPAHSGLWDPVMVREDLSHRDLLLFLEWDEDTYKVRSHQSNRFIDHLFKWKHEETATGKRGKDRKHKNL